MICQLEEMRARFEAWFKIAYPIFGDQRDMTLKHQLWTAWQAAGVAPDVKVCPACKPVKEET